MERRLMGQRTRGGDPSSVSASSEASRRPKVVEDSSRADSPQGGTKLRDIAYPRATTTFPFLLELM